MLAAGFPTVPASAQNAVMPAVLETTSADTAIIEMFKAFPSGGAPLSNRIADFVVNNPKLASALANYVVSSKELSRAQKIAAEHGMAAAMQRLGINAADMGMPTKAPPPPVEEFNAWWLVLAAALIGGIVACVLACSNNHKPPIVSPN
jgi:hypothetical protein